MSDAGAVAAAPPAAVRETHSAVVILVGDRAYKVKKPVALGFLDFRTREAREAACLREVELNRRFAPDVYLGVADVVGPDGAVCDHLVVMRRMPDDRRLSTLAVAGRPLDDAVRRLAHDLAGVLESADDLPEAAEVAGRDALGTRWEDNLAVLRACAGDGLDAAVVERVGELARRYLAGRGALFEHRIAAGRARAGHGDLLADDVFVLDDGPRVLDCLEFDDRLRLGDVLADVAFLAMDLERLGRPELADRFLAAYRELSGDNWPSSLAHHHVAYRAGVRAKVACIRHRQGGAGLDDAAAFLDLARRHVEAGRVRLVLVGGLPGSGKTTVAAAVADALGAVAVRSDEVRKELAGMGVTERAVSAVGEGLYTAQRTASTYDAMVGRARALLLMGESVVLDATWLDARWREAARAVAVEAVADLVELRCVVAVDVAAARTSARLAAGGDASDATETVVRAMAETRSAWPTALPVDTSGTPDAARRAALEAVQAR